jgi:hypothetical protein
MRQAYEPQNTGAASTSPVVLALVSSYDNRRDADDSQAAEEAVWTAPRSVNGRAGTCQCHVLCRPKKPAVRRHLESNAAAGSAASVSPAESSAAEAANHHEMLTGSAEPRGGRRCQPALR